MIKFRPYQRQCIDAFYNYYGSGNTGNGLIVVPTAGGKSLIIGGLATEIVREWPGQRILILSHVRELIAQNFEKVKLCHPESNAGIYSAALKRREIDKDITVATIQSVYNKGVTIGHVDLVFVDEAHLMQFDNMGMYGTLLGDLQRINPALKVCGFTATDYRLDGGRLTEGEGRIFHDVIIEIPIKLLMQEGYLTPPISKGALIQADMAGVKKTGGDFNTKEMGKRFDQKKFLNAALDYDIEFLQDRRSIAFFCATLDNAYHVAEGMIERGIDCEVVDGAMAQEDREDKFERFRSGELRGLASVGVMTTGTDIPNIDAVVLLIATESPGRYQQTVGRGFRVVYAPGFDIDTKEGRLAAISAGPKQNFLILDHGGNIERHGPIVSVKKPRKKEKGEKSLFVANGRICGICREGYPLDVKICTLCGHQMVADADPTRKLTLESSNADILGDDFSLGKEARWFDVDKVEYKKHIKEGQPHTLKVLYQCGILTFIDWIHLERVGNMRANAIKWWGERIMDGDFDGHYLPNSIDEALKFVHRLRKPKSIQVVKNGDFFRVLRHDFYTSRQGSATTPA